MRAGENQYAAVGAMDQTGLERDFTVKLAHAAKELLRFDPVGGSTGATLAKLSSAVCAGESEILPPST
jgi:hypothetical protein